MRPGRPKYGKTKKEREIIEKAILMLRKRKDGTIPGYYKVAGEINQLNIPSPSGRNWSGQSLKNIVERHENLLRNPKKKRNQKTKLSPRDYLNIEQIKICRNVLSDYKLLVFDFLWSSGLRASEFCDLIISDIIIENGKNYIRVRHGKGDKERFVELVNCNLQKLNEYIEKRTKSHGLKEPLFYNKYYEKINYEALRYMIMNIGKRAGISWLRPHKLRHTFGTLLYHKTKDLNKVKTQMGHASIKTTEIYIDTIVTPDEDPMKEFSEWIECKIMGV